MFGIALMLALVTPGLAKDQASSIHRVIIPEEDRFTPFAVTIHLGETVRFVNRDTDDHTVVSIDALNTAGHKNTNHLILGTDNNGGQAGVFNMTFRRAGTFVYYCRFHATLDASNQPIAPGPDGGIPGTPMMGVITVLP
ncbi:MAG TPA: plastocyanin/azurin family copper-binding protein [Anaerolineae bacterium]|nr:plastocyanin/azurin family copper-binding protein [Anaerolineae bacterium]